jgi:hypothetical protein
MKTIVARAGMTLAAVFSVAAHAQTELQTYVQRCQNELQFAAADVPPLNCNQGERFAGAGRTILNDFIVYHRVTDTVDLVAACRWGDDTSSKPYENTKFFSLELLIHNRQNGATCFFAAKDTLPGDAPVASAIVSPTNFSATRPNANDYWLQPTELNNKTLPSDRNAGGGPVFNDPIQCVGCHSGGAILASSRIAPYLANYGLLNNRHDTLVNPANPNRYRVVGSNPHTDPTSGNHAFKAWNYLISRNNGSGATCSSSCHALGGNSPIGNLFDPKGNTSSDLLPSIITDIRQLLASGMPPSADDSPYRWINLDTPGNGVESESFAEARSSSTPAPTPQLLQGCAAPGYMEGHAVGVTEFQSFSSEQLAKLPDRLRTFNAKEGLVCLQADQDPGNSCKEYQTSYLCNSTWTPWNDQDVASTGDGDREPRSGAPNSCAAPAAIKARITAAGTTTEVIGPADRLSRVSAYGMTCNNADQVDGKCSNYVVRYRACTTAPVSRQAHITSVFSGRQLTATGTPNNSPARAQPYTRGWNTQNWELVPVANTEYVRLRNTGTNTYLNVSSQAESAAVGTHALNTGYDSQVFIVEPVRNGNDVRLKNLWSGKYLTVFDTGDYSPIYSQSLNPAWSSQRWVIQ